MNKSLRILFAVFALLGMINCFVLEPALASQETAAACASDDGCDDCFVCCSFNHQIIPSISVSLMPIAVVLAFVAVLTARPVEAPSFAIFHPPISR